MANTVPDEVPVDSYPPGLYVSGRRTDYIETLKHIGESERAQFHQRGYLAVRQAFSPDQVQTAGQAMWDLIDGVNPDFKGLQAEAGKRAAFDHLASEARRDAVRKLWQFIDYDRRLKDLSEDVSLIEVVSRLMDDTPVLFQDMGLIKPPRIGREKPWHQDCAYFNYPVETPVVGVWIAIDPATEENGCLHLIPGSHKEGPKPHFNLRDWQICDTEVAVERDVTVPLEAGGCLIWHGLLHHGSPANASNQRRRALQYHYRPQSAVALTKEDRMALYGGESLGITC
ncbi:MAG: phytanoyl-CoA dioxygenase family protein [bacterium]|jgi:phytanoyl-CoA hydroxylase|nr:phytanoyl-CoA dioxygenase family protein [bacterium]